MEQMKINQFLQNNKHRREGWKIKVLCIMCAKINYLKGLLKGSIFLKNRHIFIQERFDKIDI